MSQAAAAPLDTPKSALLPLCTSHFLAKWVLLPSPVPSSHLTCTGLSDVGLCCSSHIVLPLSIITSSRSNDTLCQYLVRKQPLFVVLLMLIQKGMHNRWIPCWCLD